MRKLLPFLFSLFFAFTALAETTRCHPQAANAPCPVACLSNCCGAVCANPDLKSSVVPAEAGSTVVASVAEVFVHRLSEDEIFHPPAV